MSAAANPPTEIYSPGLEGVIAGAGLSIHRRQLLSNETRSPSRRTLVLIAVALAAFALALAAVLYFQGA